MADEEHVALLKQGVEVWNAWREEHPNILPVLLGANLHGANLIGANLAGALLNLANLASAKLTDASLAGADLSSASLASSDLTGANLRGARLDGANLMWANLTGADLSTPSGRRVTSLVAANLVDADLSRAVLGHNTVFGDVDLTKTKGLETCIHTGRCTIDHRTLQRSGPLPLAFLRGVGLPDNLIDYLPSLLNQPIQFYSCFISYSSKDQKFADRLYADLQNKGVRCWFAPHDMPIGAKIIDAIDEAIRLRDKVLLILSEHSVASDWVEEEVTRALDEERSRKTTVLFPIRVDDAVLNTTEASMSSN